MQLPTNAIAETVAALQKDIESFKEHINYYQVQIAKNTATIDELSPLATWENVPDEVDPNSLV